MLTITQKQADLLVRLGGYSYEEIRNWPISYASKVIADLLAKKNKKTAVKAQCVMTF